MRVMRSSTAAFFIMASVASMPRAMEAVSRNPIDGPFMIRRSIPA
jgi:hypothetical protein